MSFDDPVERAGSHAEKYALCEKRFGTSDVLPMWVADMDLESPPCVVEAIQKRTSHKVYGYECMPESAYQAQIAWMLRRHSFELEREWLLFSPSVVTTISTAIQAFTKPGEKVIVQPPVYPPFASCVQGNGRQLVQNPLMRTETGDYAFDFDDLLKKIDRDTKLLLLCSPHNPVGRVWHEDELSTLAQICLRYGIKVVADEIHSDLVFAPSTHIPFASLDEDVGNITVTAIGPGKSFNISGLSISTVAIPDDTLRERFRIVQERIHASPGTVFGYVGFEAAYLQGEAWLESLLPHLQTNLGRLDALVGRYSDQLRFRVPEGTYLAWLDCSPMQVDDDALQSFFIEEARLGLVPGRVFGMEGCGYMRMNVAVSTRAMDEAIFRLENALTRRKG